MSENIYEHTSIDGTVTYHTDPPSTSHGGIVRTIPAPPSAMRAMVGIDPAGSATDPTLDPYRIGVYLEYSGTQVQENRVFQAFVIPPLTYLGEPIDDVHMDDYMPRLLSRTVSDESPQKTWSIKTLASASHGGVGGPSSGDTGVGNEAYVPDIRSKKSMKPQPAVDLITPYIAAVGYVAAAFEGKNWLGRGAFAIGISPREEYELKRNTGVPRGLLDRMARVREDMGWAELPGKGTI